MTSKYIYSIKKLFSSKVIKSQQQSDYKSKRIIKDILDNYKGDRFHQLGLSVELLKNIESENEIYKNSISSELNKLIIENNYSFSKDTLNNIYLNKSFGLYSVIAKFQPLYPRTNDYLVNELQKIEDEEDTLNFDGNNLYETGGEIYHRDQTEWFCKL